MSDAMTVAELAKAFAMTPRQVRYRLKKYDVPYRRAGNCWLINPEEFIMLSLWRSAPKESPRVLP